MGVLLDNRKNSTRSFILRSEPNPETDRELEWLFTRAETEISIRSNWSAFADAALSGDHVEGDSMDEVEARTFAMHRARLIEGWLDAMPAPLAAVLVAAYEPRPWPAHYELKLGRLAGVVARLPSVRADFARAKAQGRTSARDPVDWIDEGIVRGQDARAEAAWEEALPGYARALAAYRTARGTRPCLMRDEEAEP